MKLTTRQYEVLRWMEENRGVALYDDTRLKWGAVLTKINFDIRNMCMAQSNTLESLRDKGAIILGKIKKTTSSLAEYEPSSLGKQALEEYDA